MKKGVLFFLSGIIAGAVLGFVHKMLNPMAGSIKEFGLYMDELKSFRTQIDNYIKEVEMKHPDYHIAYYFRDMNNGIWIGIDEREKFSPASLMKVPVMLAILKESEFNPQLLQGTITYDSNLYSVDEFARKHIQGQAYTIENLIREMIGYSDNISTLMLVKAIGFEKITKVQEDLNIYIDKTATSQDNIISIKNYTSIFRILYNASYLNQQLSEKALEILSDAQYEPGIRAAIPKDVVVAQKYGERDGFDASGKKRTEQLHNIGIVYYPGKPFLLGIMIKGKDRTAMQKILKELASITYKEVDSQMKAFHSSKILSDAR